MKTAGGAALSPHTLTRNVAARAQQTLGVEEADDGTERRRTQAGVRQPDLTPRLPPPAAPEAPPKKGRAREHSAVGVEGRAPIMRQHEQHVRVRRRVVEGAEGKREERTALPVDGLEAAEQRAD